VCPLLGFHLLDVSRLESPLVIKAGVGAFVQEHVEHPPSDGSRRFDYPLFEKAAPRQALAILDRVAFRDELHGDCHELLGRRLAGGL